MPLFVLHHCHEPAECRFAFAAWRGFDSPLRKRPAVCGCRHETHELWWVVEAADAGAALAQLPPFLVARTRVTAVVTVTIP